MDRSTPLNHLQRSADQDPGAAEMMDNIVHDLEEGEHQHQHQPSQEEIQYMQHQQMLMQQQQMQEQQQQQRAAGAPEGHYGPMVPPRMQKQPPQLENKSLGQKVMAEAKEPLLVSVIVMLMSSGQLQSLISKFLPIAAGNPLIGLGLRAVVAGLLFYLLRRFIPA